MSTYLFKPKFSAIKSHKMKDIIVRLENFTAYLTVVPV